MDPLEQLTASCSSIDWESCSYFQPTDFADFQPITTSQVPLLLFDPISPQSLSPGTPPTVELDEMPHSPLLSQLLNRPKRNKYPPIPADAFRPKVVNGKVMHFCTFKDCQRSFTRNGVNAKSHWYLHQNIMPFQCKHCGNRFIRRNDCKRHELAHLNNF